MIDEDDFGDGTTAGVHALEQQIEFVAFSIDARRTDACPHYERLRDDTCTLAASMCRRSLSAAFKGPTATVTGSRVARVVS